MRSIQIVTAEQATEVVKMSPREKAIRLRLRDDFPHYARKCLKIRSKELGIIPLDLNEIQKLIHTRLEEQLTRRGYVRVLIIKPRQPGVSTYVQARFFHKVTHRKGVQAFILTHEQDATDNIFEMVDRYYQHCPDLVKPSTSAANAKELKFDRLDSGYSVATARTKGTGRSGTFQLFHGSEVAYWTNAASHMAGVMQAIPKQGKGTEIILESTGNGVGGLFYALAKDAAAGQGEFELIFIPWFTHAEYRMTASAGWRAPAAFLEYQEAHGLSREQLYFAYVTNAELAKANNQDSDEITASFRQEYPAVLEDAFQASTSKTFIRTDLVAKARRFEAPDQSHAAMVLGVDVSGGINDKTWIIDRQARKAGARINVKFKETDQMVIAGKLARLIDELLEEGRPLKAVFIDVGGGYGSGVYDRLLELDYNRKVAIIAVQFGSSPQDPLNYTNKRAEMWGEMREWLDDPGGAEIPDDDELHSHICAPNFKLNSNDQIVLEKKEQIKERLGFSPDGGDALALTFAEPVTANPRKLQTTARGTGRGWMGS